MERALTDFINESTKSRKELFKKTDESQKGKGAIELFLDSAGKRITNLPQKTQSLVQLQISQIIFNAENPGMPVPITSLPSRRTWIPPYSAANSFDDYSPQTLSDFSDSRTPMQSSETGSTSDILRSAIQSSGLY